MGCCSTVSAGVSKRGCFEGAVVGGVLTCFRSAVRAFRSYLHELLVHLGRGYLFFVKVGHFGVLCLLSSNFAIDEKFSSAIRSLWRFDTDKLSGGKIVLCDARYPFVP
jgi:hypothetical protein